MSLGDALLKIYAHGFGARSSTLVLSARTLPSCSRIGWPISLLEVCYCSIGRILSADSIFAKLSRRTSSTTILLRLPTYPMRSCSFSKDVRLVYIARSV